VTHSRAHTVDFIQQGNNQTVEVSKVQHQNSKQKRYISLLINKTQNQSNNAVQTVMYLASWKRRLVLGWYISNWDTSSKAEGAIIVMRDTTTLT